MIPIRGGDYEHVIGLVSKIVGHETEYLVSPLNETFARMIGERAFEICEFSFSNYLMLKDRKADWLTAIPVFPYRAFRHSALYVRRDSPLKDPRALGGKRIAVPDYSMTAAVWTRGILKDFYGIDWAGLQWVTGLRQRFPTPDGVSITRVEADLEESLLKGEVDVLLTTSTRDEKLPPNERRLRCLFNDVQAVEEQFYRDTGLYPIHHTVVLREDVLASHPGLPKALFEAYAAVKSDAYARRLGATMLPWGSLYWSRQFGTFGGDPLPYGLTDANLRTIDRLSDYLLDQRLIETKPDPATLFAPGSDGWRG